MEYELLYIINILSLGAICLIIGIHFINFFHKKFKDK